MVNLKHLGQHSTSGLSAENIFLRGKERAVPLPRLMQIDKEICFNENLIIIEVKKFQDCRVRFVKNMYLVILLMTLLNIMMIPVR